MESKNIPISFLYSVSFIKVLYAYITFHHIESLHTHIQIYILCIHKPNICHENWYVYSYTWNTVHKTVLGLLKIKHLPKIIWQTTTVKIGIRREKSHDSSSDWKAFINMVCQHCKNNFKSLIPRNIAAKLKFLLSFSVESNKYPFHGISWSSFLE